MVAHKLINTTPPPIFKSLIEIAATSATCYLPEGLT